MNEYSPGSGCAAGIVGRRRSPGLVPVLIVGLAGLAYHPLWLQPARYDTDALLFLPGGLPALAVVSLGLWLLWRRRAWLLSLEGSADSSPGRLAKTVAWALAGVGTAFFAWAVLTSKIDLLLPSLAALGLALAIALRGWPAGRAASLPAFVLLLGIRLPKPLEDELVWHLQRWTAEWASGLLDLAGRDFIQSGVILRNADHTFHVIDSCSGLNGIGILLLIALLVREIFAGAGRRLWLIVAIAPVLAFLLNVLRVSYVAASPDPEALAGIEGDHTYQGMAVLMMGTVVLYGLGGLLGRGHEEPPASDRLPSVGTHGRGRLGMPSAGRGSGWAIRVAAVWLCGLMALSWILPRFAAPEPAFLRVPVIDLPESKAGWASIPAPHEPLFTGVFARGMHRRYRRDTVRGQAPEIVDLLIGYEDTSRSESTRLMSSKLLSPGPEWQVETEWIEKIWALDRQAEHARASRHPGGEQALVYAWRPGHRGLWRESWRSLLALDASPLARARPRAIVRLAVYAPHDGQLALDRAKQRLDGFVMDFRKELAGL